MLEKTIRCLEFLVDHVVGRMKWSASLGLMIRHTNGSVTLLGGVLLPMLRSPRRWQDSAFYTAVQFELVKARCASWIFSTLDEKGVWLPWWDASVIQRASHDPSLGRHLVESGAQLAPMGANDAIKAPGVPTFVPPNPQGPIAIYQDRWNWWIHQGGDRFYRIPANEVAQFVGVTRKQIRPITHALTKTLHQRIQQWFEETHFTWDELAELFKAEGHDVPDDFEDTSMPGRDWIALVEKIDVDLGNLLRTSAWELFKPPQKPEDRDALQFETIEDVRDFLKMSDMTPCVYGLADVLDSVKAEPPYTADDLIAAARHIIATPGKWGLEWAHRILDLFGEPKIDPCEHN